VGPLGGIVRGLGFGVSTVALLVLAPVPFVIFALLQRPDSRRRLVLIAPFALLVLLAGVSLLWSPSPGPGVEKLAVLVLTGLIPAAFLLVLTRAAAEISWPLIVIAALFSAVALIALGEYSPLYPDRLSVFGDNPIWTARAAFIGAIVLLFGPFPWLARLLGVPVLVVAGVLTASLGPAVGLVFGSLAGVVVALHQASRANRRVLPVAVGLGALFGIALVAIVADVFSGSSSSIFSRLFVNDPNVAGRASFLAVAVPMFLGAPLQGVGIGGFAASGLSAYPHNLVAEIAAELGVLGLLAYASWLALALRGALRSPLLTALVVATTLFSLFSGSIASNVEFWLFTAVAVALVPIGSRPADKLPASRPAAESRLDASASAS
jgi:O-antigen ligase